MKKHICKFFLVFITFLFAIKGNIDPILLSGTIEYANELGQKEILSLQHSINADTFQILVETLLHQESWSVNAIKENHLKIFSDDSLTRAYDFGSSDSGARFDFTIASTTYGAGGVASSIHFHPTGKYLLVGGAQSVGVNSQIFAFSETGSALYALIACNQLHGGTITAARWSPNGQYYALAGTTSANTTSNVGTVTFNTAVRLYQFDDLNRASTLLPYAQIDHGATLTTMDWHPSGNYLAVGGVRGTNNATIRIYQFNGSLLTELPYCSKDCTFSSTITVSSMSWHPSGNYLVVGHGDSALVNVNVRNFHFTGDNLIELTNCRINLINGVVQWSNSGMYLAVADSLNMRIYEFSNNNSFILRATVTRAAGAFVNQISWAPDDAYITLAGYTAAGTYAETYQFQANALTNLTAAASTHGATLWATHWSPDGSFIAYSGDSAAGINLRAYQFTENTTELTRKNRGMLYQINNSIKQSYQDVLETQTLIQATSSAILTANPLYLSPTSTLNPGIQFTSVAWENISPAASSFNPQYHDWHPSGKYLAVSEGSDGSGDNFLHVFSQDTSSTFKPVHSTYFPTRVGSDYRPQALSWAPNGNYLSVQLGPSNLPETETKLYSFDGSTLALTLTSIFFSRQAPAWHPNSSFLLTTTPSNIFTLLNFNNDYTATYQSGFSIPSSSTIGRGEWNSDGKSFFTFNSGTGAIGGYFYDFTSETGSCTQLFSTGIPSTAITNISLCPQIDSTDESAYLAVGFNGSAPNLRVYQFNGVSQATPSVTIIPGCSLNEETSVKNVAWSKDGQHLAVVWGGSPQYMQVYRFMENSWLSPTGLILQNTDTGTGSLSWDPLSLFIAQAPSGSNVAPFIIRPDKYFHQNLLVAISNEVNALVSSIDTALITANSNAIVTYNNLAVATSQGWVTDYNLIIENSNAVNAHLIGMSNAMAQLAVQTSYAIVSIDTLNKTTSNAIVADNLLNIANSNVLVTYRPLIIANSNAISGLLVATSQAISGLLVATSDATAGLLVATSQAVNATAIKAARLDTIDTGPSNIHFNAASITMTYNLLLSTDHQLFVHASGVVNGNGHSITFARGAGTQLTVDPSITTTFQNVIFKDYNEQATSLGAGSSLIFGNNCRVEISEPQTLLRTWSFAGISQLNGLGNALTLGTGPRFLSTLISSSLQLSNLKLLNVRENNIRAANNNAAILYQDVVLNMSADFTYSVGSMLIQNDVTIRGTSTFNYTTIMGCTVSPASQLTIDPGVSFNYAPAGNFRNLLSLTDSSARLYFKNATLVATSTGARLTKGTLLIDGIMNIQSGAASSAQAVIFGDTTPANDLMIKLLPSATINLMSGFLNYANAQ